MMQSIGEHQEVPKEEAAVMLVGGLRKWCRDWNLATGRCQKLKGKIQASCELRKRLTIAGRKMTCHARVGGIRGTPSGKTGPGSRLSEESGEYGRSGRKCRHTMKAERD
jgi:hypothetical protein